ncbi:MAG: hypothetical protein RLZ64_912 [Pseudomonadota bacterium]
MPRKGHCCLWREAKSLRTSRVEFEGFGLQDKPRPSGCGRIPSRGEAASQSGADRIEPWYWSGPHCVMHVQLQEERLEHRRSKTRLFSQHIAQALGSNLEACRIANRLRRSATHAAG